MEDAGDGVMNGGSLTARRIDDFRPHRPTTTVDMYRTALHRIVRSRRYLASALSSALDTN